MKKFDISKRKKFIDSYPMAIKLLITQTIINYHKRLPCEYCGEMIDHLNKTTYDCRWSMNFIAVPRQHCPNCKKTYSTPYFWEDDKTIQIIYEEILADERNYYWFGNDKYSKEDVLEMIFHE